MNRIRLSRALAVLAFPAGLAFATAGIAQAATPCPTDLPLMEAGKLTMSTNATMPPTQFIDKSGNIVGMNIDFGNEIAKRLCLTPVYQNVSFEVQIPGLQTKRWDMINTGLYYNADRVKIMRLIPYEVGSLGVVVASGNPLGIKKVEDLAGKRIGVEIGGVEEKNIKALSAEQAAKGLAPMDIHVFNTYGETFLAMGGGQLDGVFVGDTLGKYYQSQGKFTSAITGLYAGAPGAFAVMEPKLADAIVAVLNDMLKDGTYAALMDKYGTTKVDAWKDWKGQFAAYYQP